VHHQYDMVCQRCRWSWCCSELTRASEMKLQCDPLLDAANVPRLREPLRGHPDSARPLVKFPESSVSFCTKPWRNPNTWASFRPTLLQICILVRFVSLICEVWGANLWGFCRTSFLPLVCYTCTSIWCDLRGIYLLALGFICALEDRILVKGKDG
jgi:hypothetical protein